jgi:hypothetical protein
MDDLAVNKRLIVNILVTVNITDFTIINPTPFDHPKININYSRRSASQREEVVRLHGIDVLQVKTRD